MPFVIGQTVRTTALLNVRTAPGLTSPVAGPPHPTGSRALIVGGPVAVAPYTWWQLDYTTGADGWSAGEFLAMAIPELPRVYIDTTMPVTTGYVTKTVGVGKDFATLTAALASTSVKNATTGIILSVTAGETFAGTVTLPVHTNPWLIIQSSALASLPVGTRVGPANASSMPKLHGTGSPVIALQTAAAASRYRFIGLEIAPQPGLFSTGLIRLGTGLETLLTQLPGEIIFDRCYIHGDPTLGSRAGIRMNSKTTAAIDSYLSDFKEVGADSQAIVGWNGPGPFKIVNNYLEGAGENVLFGGADPTIPNLIPSDIEVRRNHMKKPLTWRLGDPTYAGTLWNVKNLFELKNAQRVLLEGNIIENCWVQGQAGIALNLKSANQDGTAPWSGTLDVTVRYNIIRHAAMGVQFLGQDTSHPCVLMSRVAIQHNLFDDIDGPRWGGGEYDGKLFLVLGPTADLTLEHNTSPANFYQLDADGPPSTGLSYRANIAPNEVHGAGQGTGNTALAAFFPGAVFTTNAMIGATAAYPTGNFKPATLAAVGFTDLPGGNYRLAASSPYKGAAYDGKDLGVDFVAFDAALAPPAPPTTRARIDITKTPASDGSTADIYVNGVLIP